jgi:hypothetical protein
MIFACYDFVCSSLAGIASDKRFQNLQLRKWERKNTQTLSHSSVPSERIISEKLKSNTFTPFKLGMIALGCDCDNDIDDKINRTPPTTNSKDLREEVSCTSAGTFSKSSVHFLSRVTGLPNVRILCKTGTIYI